jgi:serine/threonine protein kinase
MAAAADFQAPKLDPQLFNLSKKKQLGYGAFAKIYSCTLKDGTKVAVKIYQKSDSPSEEIKSQKVKSQEIEALASIPKHKNLLAFIGIVDFKDPQLISPCIVTELLGQELLDYINATPEDKKNFGVLQQSHPDMCCIVAFDVASGLKALHEIGIIHRDIKPENILLGFDGYWKIADFGFACKANEINEKSISGTDMFYAPEICKKLIQKDKTIQFSYPVDVYSYGVVLLALLATNKYIEIYNDSLKQKQREQFLRNVMTFGIDKYIVNIDPALIESFDPKLKILWNLMLQCCNVNPEARNTTEMICKTLAGFFPAVEKPPEPDIASGSESSVKKPPEPDIALGSDSSENSGQKNSQNSKPNPAFIFITLLLTNTLTANTFTALVLYYLKLFIGALEQSLGKVVQFNPAAFFLPAKENKENADKSNKISNVTQLKC